GVPVNRQSQGVFNKTSKELTHIQNLPPGSHKWTWGPELSANEVRELIPPPGCRKPPHSGYMRSLPEGLARSFFSSDPSLPTVENAEFSPLAADNLDLPPMAEGNASIDMI